MLPARGMKLPKDAEEQLKRLKQQKRITPNVASRMAFFASVESGYRYIGEDIKLDGDLKLDKVTWLGDLSIAIESILAFLYGKLNEKESGVAWAAHVSNGTKMLTRNI